MEDDRALVDLGIATEIEETQAAQNAMKQPKRRFVGRRAAAEASKSASANTLIEDSGAIQGTATLHCALAGMEADTPS